MTIACTDATADRPLAILLMGPTAAGKTDLALRLVAEFPCSIVSVDSAMVYRGMDIGTAKPSAAILAHAPHRLIDLCEPSEAYSAARFRADALAAMAEIVAAGRVPLLVGGTMLYFRALRHGLAPLPEADPALRQTLTEHAARAGTAALHRWLARVDPVTAARVHPNDPQRIQRALEVYLIAGEPLSVLWQRARAQALPYRTLALIRAPMRRDLLRARIVARFDAMLEAGFVAEVARLRARPDIHPGLPAMRCVGYRQMLAYLAGEDSFATMRQRTLLATGQLAKRQLTWLRAEDDAHWLPDDDTAGATAARLIRAVW